MGRCVVIWDNDGCGVSVDELVKEVNAFCDNSELRLFAMKFCTDHQFMGVDKVNSVGAVLNTWKDCQQDRHNQ